MIQFKDVTKKYPNGTVAVDNLDLIIHDKEFVFIVGESGAGKSTLTKLLLREEKVTSGSIIVDGEHIENLKESKIPKYRRKLGVVFQDFRLFPDQTVYENVAFAMRAVGTPGRKIRMIVPRLLAIVGLSEKKKSFPGELSGGEQQRVALARAIANNPSIILADEPTGNIDPKRSQEIMGMLLKINRMGKTVIVVTHEQNLVDMFQQRVVTIKNGKVVSDREGGMFQ